MTDIFSSALKVRCQKLQLRWKILPEKLKVTIFLHISLCGKFLSAFYFFYSCVLGGQYFFLFSTVNHCNLAAYHQGRVHDLRLEGRTWVGGGGTNREKRRPPLALHEYHNDIVKSFLSPLPIPPPPLILIYISPVSFPKKMPLYPKYYSRACTSKFM